MLERAGILIGVGLCSQICAAPPTWLHTPASKRPPEPSTLQSLANRTKLGGTRVPESARWAAVPISAHALQAGSWSQHRCSKRPPEPSALQSLANRTKLGGTRAPESARWTTLPVPDHASQAGNRAGPRIDAPSGLQNRRPSKACKTPFIRSDTQYWKLPILRRSLTLSHLLCLMFQNLPLRGNGRHTGP